MPYQTPLITKDEFNKQQYKIDDLRWDMLRKETERANSKHCTLSSSSVPSINAHAHCGNSKRYNKSATSPITDVHMLSMLNIVNKKDRRDQKPTAHSRRISVL